MPTSVSPITEQTNCIYLQVDQDAPLEALLEEAKELATNENTMVMFAVFTYGTLFQVTSESNIEHMAIRYRDRFNCSMLIT